MYDAILFDFDGVLVDSERVHLACWMEALAPFHIQIDWQTYCDRYIGVDDRVMLAGWCNTVDPPVPFEDAWARYPFKKQLFEASMHRPDAITAGVLALLEELHSRLKLAVVTSSARSEIEPILVATGAARFIDTAVYGDEVPRHKPAPDPYLIAAERLGARNPLVVEDSAAGLASGRAAGFHVLHIPEQPQMIDLLRAQLVPVDHRGK